MISELVVDVQPKEVSIAVLEDKNLVELQKEARNVSFAVGDIYLGKVKKLMPVLNAAFIDVGYKKDAFLHYLDLGPNFNTQQKFLKQALGEQKGDKKIPTISKMQLLPEIEKEHQQRAQSRTGSAGADRQRADFNKRSQADFRAFFCRKIHRADTVCR